MNPPLPCPADRVRITAPADDVRIATGDGLAAVGLLEDSVVRWAPQTVPAPLRMVADLEDVAYHRMWSGVLAVDLPSRQPLRIWFCDGEEQVLLLRQDADGHPELFLP